MSNTYANDMKLLAPSGIFPKILTTLCIVEFDQSPFAEGSQSSHRNLPEGLEYLLELLPEGFI